MAILSLQKLGKSFRFFDNPYILAGLIILVAVAASYLLLNYRAKDILVEQMLHRGQISARAGAKSIESFFDLYSRALLNLASRSDVVNFAPDLQIQLEDFIATWNGTPVGGVIVVGKDGIVKFNGNRDRIPQTGVDLSDRDFFIWSKTAKAGEVFISAPVVSRLGASKDKFVVSIATPIFDKSGEYKGSLSTSIILDELTVHYVSPLKITEKSYEYLLNENSDVLGTDQKGVIGVNFIAELNKNPFVGALVLSPNLEKILTSRQEGKVQVAFPTEIPGGVPVPMLVAYSPVQVGDNHLMVAVSTPIEEALIYLVPIYIYGLEITAGAFMVILLLTLRLARLRGYSQAVAEEHKIHNIDS